MVPLFKECVHYELMNVKIALFYIDPTFLALANTWLDNRVLEVSVAYEETTNSLLTCLKPSWQTYLMRKIGYSLELLVLTLILVEFKSLL